MVEPHATVLQVGPCPILQVRDQTRDGYDAVQLGFLNKLRRKASRAERGHVAGGSILFQQPEADVVAHHTHDVLPLPH